MAMDLTVLVAQEVPTRPGTLHTVPSGSKVRILEILLSNNAGAARTVKIWLVPSGGSRGDGNEISGGGISVPTGIPFAIAVGTVLNAGDTIQADADNGDVAIRVSGVSES